MAGAQVRVATYDLPLSGRGPGLVLQSLQQGGDAGQQAAVAVIAALGADVLLLTGIDYDLGGETLTAFNGLLAKAGADYPNAVALRPNTGIPTGFDIDQNGQLGQARDAMAYGRYPGADGMAVLSKLPLGEVTDYSGYLWADLPGTLTPDTDPGLRQIQRLSTSGHYQVQFRLPDGRDLALLAFAATPPVFDGPNDRNGRRNHDETAFWLRLIAGDLPWPPPAPPFVVLGLPNLDPQRGDGRRDAIRDLMQELQDPTPNQDTALFDQIGGLRVDQVLPSRDISVIGAGVLAGDPQASRHRPVYVDIKP